MLHARLPGESELLDRCIRDVLHRELRRIRQDDPVIILLINRSHRDQSLAHGIRRRCVFVAHPGVCRRDRIALTTKVDKSQFAVLTRIENLTGLAVDLD